MASLTTNLYDEENIKRYLEAKEIEDKYKGKKKSEWSAEDKRRYKGLVGFFDYLEMKKEDQKIEKEAKDKKIEEYQTDHNSIEKIKEYYKTCEDKFKESAYTRDPKLDISYSDIIKVLNYVLESDNEANKDYQIEPDQMPKLF